MELTELTDTLEPIARSHFIHMRDFSEREAALALGRFFDLMSTYGLGLSWEIRALSGIDYQTLVTELHSRLSA